MTEYFQSFVYVSDMETIFGYLPQEIKNSDLLSILKSNIKTKKIWNLNLPLQYMYNFCSLCGLY